MSERTGRCLCGAVNFKLAADPIVTRICWCRDCQHLAANGTVNLLVAAEGLSVSGQLHEYTQKADSGNDVPRQFCPSCGIHLFAKVAARPQFRIVRAGNLDDPSSIQPDMNIWTSSAPAWACLNTDLDQSAHQAPPPKLPSSAV
jgi:hypothetical protein